MKRVLIAVALFALLILACCGGYRAVRSTVEATASEVAHAETMLQQGAPAAAIEQLETSHARWSESRTLLGTMINHTLLDRIDTLYQRAIHCISAGGITQAFPELAELSASLQRIIDAERLTVENIL